VRASFEAMIQSSVAMVYCILNIEQRQNNASVVNGRKSIVVVFIIMYILLLRLSSAMTRGQREKENVGQNADISCYDGG
jgi:hypothetical protein